MAKKSRVLECRILLAPAPCKFGIAALLLAGLALRAQPSLAQESTSKTTAQRSIPFSISGWQVPEACGAQRQFTATVERALMDFQSDAPLLDVQIIITARGRKYKLTLFTRGKSGSGQRILRGGNCEELLATAALVLSLSLDSERLFENEKTTAMRALPTASGLKRTMGPKGLKRNRRQELDSETPSTLERPSGPLYKRRSLRDRLSQDTDIHLAAMSELGVLPNPAIGLALVASASAGEYRGSLRVTQWAQQIRQSMGVRSLRGARFTLLSATLFACRILVNRSGACLLGTVARMRAHGITDTPKSATNALASAGVSWFCERELGWSQVRLGAELSLQFLRPRYLLTLHEDPSEVDPVQIEVFRPSPITLLLSASWGLSL